MDTVTSTKARLRRLPRLIAAANSVTTMTKVKHRFDKCERGQAGVEW